MQEVESQLRLEIAHLTQQLAASSDGDSCNCEALTEAERATTLVKASAAALQLDLARRNSQRDTAWKVRTASAWCAVSAVETNACEWT